MNRYLVTLLRFLLAPVFLLLPGLASTPALSQEAAVVRLSHVSGSVQILQGTTVQFDKAVANMPLFAASTVATGQDGQAEIEFADGSVARLTPNSSLVLTHLQRAGTTGHTDVQMLSGLAYFELNVGQGQRFAVKLLDATVRPAESSVFRGSLDTTPEVAVMQGVVHVDAAGGAFSTDVNERESFHFDATDPSQNSLVPAITPNSWDQWNMDRDDAIAREAQEQTDVRNDSAAPQDPGWNDLDAAGNWYPVDGYGNVWVPNGVDQSWDPFGYGYWANYNNYGVTWISGYPWGWLPYHCGAWNYFPFGWGWVPGGCGLGWSPIVTVWNIPANYHLPAWPARSNGSFAVAGLNRTTGKPILVPVDRGPAARGPWSTQPGLIGTPGVGEHTTPIRYDGTLVQPVRHTPAQGFGALGSGIGNNRMTTVTGAHVGIPVAGQGIAGMAGSRGPAVVPGSGSSVPRPASAGRPSYTPAPRSAEPAPRAAPAPAPAAAPSRPH